MILVDWPALQSPLLIVHKTYPFELKPCPSTDTWSSSDRNDGEYRYASYGIVVDYRWGCNDGVILRKRRISLEFCRILRCQRYEIVVA